MALNFGGTPSPYYNPQKDPDPIRVFKYCILNHSNLTEYISQIDKYYGCPSQDLSKWDITYSWYIHKDSLGTSYGIRPRREHESIIKIKVTTRIVYDSKIVTTLIFDSYEGDAFINYPEYPYNAPFRLEAQETEYFGRSCIFGQNTMDVPIREAPPLIVNNFNT